MANCSIVRSGRTFTLSVWETGVSATGNYSTFHWDLTISGGGGTWYDSYAYAQVNGSVVYNNTTSWSSGAFPSADGSVGGDFTVGHNADGTMGAIYFYLEGYSNSYSVASADGYAYGSTIDRNPVSFSVSLTNATANGFKITASANGSCDYWRYRLKAGSGSWGGWSYFHSSATTQATSVAKTLTGLSSNTTYYVQILARRLYNFVDSYSSGSHNIKTLGNGVLSSTTATTIDVASPTSTIKWICYSKAFYYRITAKIGSTVYATKDFTASSTGTLTYNFAYTSTERTNILNAMSSVKSATVTYTLTTYSNSGRTSQIGSASTLTNTLSISSLSYPTWNSQTWSYYDNNSTTTSVTGDNQILIKGYSSVIVNIPSATSKNGASIVNYKIAISGKTITSASSGAVTFGAISGYGDLAVTFTVTDSRGYTATFSGTITVLNYSNISIQDYSIRRINNVETEVTLALSGRISSIMVNGSNVNSVQTAHFRYKTTSDGNYGSWTDITLTTTTYTFSFSTSDLGGVDFDSDTAYDLQIAIADKLSSNTLQLYIPLGTPLLSFRKEKLGVNTANPRFALDVCASTDDTAIGINNNSLKEYLAKSIFDKYYPVNTIYGTFNSSFNPNNSWYGTWVKLSESRFLLPYTTPNSTGGQNTVKLTSAQSGVPSHDHLMNYFGYTEGNSNIRYTVGYGYTRSGNYLNTGTNTAKDATSSHTNVPAYRTYCCWYRTA